MTVISGLWYELLSYFQRYIKKEFEKQSASTRNLQDSDNLMENEDSRAAAASDPTIPCVSFQWSSSH